MVVVVARRTRTWSCPGTGAQPHSKHSFCRKECGRRIKIVRFSKGVLIALHDIADVGLHVTDDSCGGDNL